MVIILLTLLMASWGGSFIAIKFALRELSPLELVLARFLPSAIMFVPLGLYAGGKYQSPVSFFRSLSRRERLGIFAASLCGVPVYHICLNTGETMIPAGWAGLVISLNPACITVFAALLLGEKIGLRRWGGIVLALAGLIYIAATHRAFSDSGESIPLLTRLLGILITLGAVLSWGGFTIISKRLIRDHNPMRTISWTIVLGSLWVAPLITGGFFDKLSSGSAALWLSIAYLAPLCTVIGFAVWFWALGRWQASQAGTFIYLVPLFALVDGWWLLDEPLGYRTLLGAALVLGGVILAGTKAASVPQQAV